MKLAIGNDHVAVEMKKEIKEYDKKNKTILNSTSWKITKPLRFFKRLLK